MMKELENQPVLFGLAAQGHLPNIRAMLDAGFAWRDIAESIGWEETTARAHYHLHIGSEQTRELRMNLVRAAGLLESVRRQYGVNADSLPEIYALLESYERGQRQADQITVPGAVETEGERACPSQISVEEQT